MKTNNVFIVLFIMIYLCNQGMCETIEETPKSKSNINKIYNYNFYKIIKSKKIVIVDFHADWCGPCKELIPILEKVKGAKVYKLNVDYNKVLVEKYNVRYVPALLFFKDGKLVRSTGKLSLNKIEKIIKEEN